jgi:hypothetical protein
MKFDSISTVLVEKLNVIVRMSRRGGEKPLMWWSNELGWVDTIKLATDFTIEEKETFSLPIREHDDQMIVWAVAVLPRHRSNMPVTSVN